MREAARFPSRSFRFPALAVLVALLLVLLPAHRAADNPEAARLVAIGDVHGAYAEFVGILQKTGLIDSGRRWTGGAAVLVQTGDLIDRGARARDCLELLMDLERQAARQNGRVIALLGNHEVMNLMGDLRYVSTDDFHAFATPMSPRVRDEMYDEFRRFEAGRNRRLGRPSPPDNYDARQQWTGQYRRGFFEYRDAFGPRGRYGRWLRQHDAAVQLGNTLFLHAGLSPAIEIESIDALNRRVRAEMEAFDALWQRLSEKKIIWRYMKLDEATAAVSEELNAMQSSRRPADPATVEDMTRFLAFQKSLLMSPAGPLWYRGYAELSEDKLPEEFGPLLDRLKIDHVVVGHTPTTSRRIVPRFGQRILLIDTGMMSAYQGRASALEMQGANLLIYYSDGDRQLLAPPPARPSP